jgi:Putative prokaryotic signal transducing protein
MSTPSHVDPELVTVFDTQQDSEAMVIQSLLKSAGIDSIISNLQAPQDVLPGVGGVVVRVSAAQADEARGIIDEYRNTPEALVDEAEEAAEEETAGGSGETGEG